MFLDFLDMDEVSHSFLGLLSSAPSTINFFAIVQDFITSQFPTVSSLSSALT